MLCNWRGERAVDGDLSFHLKERELGKDFRTGERSREGICSRGSWNHMRGPLKSHFVDERLKTEFGIHVTTSTPVNYLFEGFCMM